MSYNVGNEDPDGDGPLMAYTDWARLQFGRRAVSNAYSNIEGWRGSTPNYHTIGIELCHIDGEGHFTEACLESAAQLVAYLCTAHGLWILDVTTHQNIVGNKRCPALWAAEPWRLDLFRERVSQYLGEEIILVPVPIDNGSVPAQHIEDLERYKGAA